MVAIGRMAKRVCDYCARNGARWFCAGDDAFLCQSCDFSVHSANTLARRHQRVRLKSASGWETRVPVWHRNAARKARSPRQKRGVSGIAATWHPLHLVPESSSEEKSVDDEHGLYRVPTMHPLVEQFSNSPNPSGEEETLFDEFMASDIDVAEFAADVESLLGNEKFEMEEIGIFECEMLSHHQNAEEFKDHGTKMELTPSNTFLNLNFERVLGEWDDEKSPWMTGKRPDFNSGDCWLLNCTGSCGKTHTGGPIGMMTGHPAATRSDAGRGARVSRYRDKRRTRLFSKRIRYAVRKVNADNRPRMKGRFVKRELAT